MKRIIKLLALAATLAVFAIPTLAQKQECTDDNKGTWYKTFYDNYKGDAAQQKVAYDNAKLYLDSCPADPNDAQAKFMKKFVDAVEAMRNKANTGKQFEAAVTSKNYADEMKYGKEILANDPDNVDVNSILGVAGLADGSLLKESATYAAKGIQLIDSGKPIKAYPRDQALAYLNWTIGKSKLATSPADAITELLKVAKIESDVKKNPQLYLDLAAAYEAGPRAKLSKEYTDSLNPADKTETDQSKVILENLNRVIDNQIDAMARAAAFTSDAAKKKEIVAELATLYKYRNKGASDANVTELVASVVSKPIPEPPTPITSLPTPLATPAGTPATNNGGNGGATNGGGAKPAGNSLTNTSNTGGNKTGTGAVTATQSGSAKPAASPTPTKKPPLKYRRG
jgi:hypothetical protein